jgi:hypothetical protein
MQSDFFIENIAAVPAAKTGDVTGGEPPAGKIRPVRGVCRRLVNFPVTAGAVAYRRIQ